MNVEDIKPNDFVYGQVVNDVGVVGDRVFIEWIDGWNFTFPLGLDVADMGSYHEDHAG